MKRLLFFAYGLTAYLLFFGTFLYSIGFIGDLVVPKTVDSGPSGPFGAALAINLGLLTLFAAQHSGMARPAFKRWWTRIVPTPIERSTYVLLSTFAMWLLFAFWQPMGGIVWDVTNETARAAIRVVYFGGWATILLATLLISHFDLFGLRQVTLYAQGKPYTELPFGTPFLYRYVRHPLYVGWLMVFWAAPTMTLGHFVLTAMCTGYILIATQLEERDLVAHLGNDYIRYRERVPAFVPIGRRRPIAQRLQAMN